MRTFAAALGVVLAASSVAAAIWRPAPDFAALPVAAALRDRDQRPVWTVRLAMPAREIALEAVAAAPPPAGHDYELWVETAGGPRSLGLLPASGRKVVPEIPARLAQVAGGGKLFVTLEGAGGSPTGKPTGPALFDARLAHR